MRALASRWSSASRARAPPRGSPLGPARMRARAGRRGLAPPGDGAARRGRRYRRCAPALRGERAAPRHRVRRDAEHGDRGAGGPDSRRRPETAPAHPPAPPWPTCTADADPAADKGAWRRVGGLGGGARRNRGARARWRAARAPDTHAPRRRARECSSPSSTIGPEMPGSSHSGA